MRTLVVLLAFLGVLSVACSDQAEPAREGDEVAATATAAPPPLFTGHVRVYPHRDPGPLPSGVTLEIGEAVPAEVAGAARAIAAATSEAFAEHYEQDLSGLTIHVHWDAEAFARVFGDALDAHGLTRPSSSYASSVQGGKVFVYEGEIFWLARKGSTADTATAELWDAIPREAVELVRTNLTGQIHGDRGFNQVAGGLVPDWFTLGQEQFVVAAVRGTYNLSRANSALSINRSIPPVAANTRSLREVAADDLDYRDTNADEYKLGLAAVDALVGDDAWGASSFRFWDELGRDVPYQEAFRDCFGMSMDEFYERFEASRKASG